ncbi:MAG TPA: hypothetical protein VII24_07695 [Pseudolabrys sp.]
MTDSRKFQRIVAAALLAASLAGCTTSGGTSDDMVGRFLVAPDKFVFYNCEQLAAAAKSTTARTKELERLMEKAGPGADGRLVSAVAYRPEYLERRGDMYELRNAAIAKNCKFVPGAENTGGRASSGAVR